VSAALVQGAPQGLPAVDAPPTPEPTPTPPPTPVLVVPPGVTPPTPTITPIPTVTATPLGAPTATATATPPQPLVRIIALDRANEWVILYNDGSAAQDLTGWSLLSEAGNVSCPLSGSIAPRASLRVWSQVGPDGLSCGLAQELWANSGEGDAVLVNAGGEQVSRIK
jgi:hypothetical protein